MLLSVPPPGPCAVCNTGSEPEGAVGGRAAPFLRPPGDGCAALAGSRAGAHQALGRCQCPGQELADPAARGGRQQGGEVRRDPHPPAEQRQRVGPRRAHGAAPRRPQRPHRGEWALPASPGAAAMSCLSHLVL